MATYLEMANAALRLVGARPITAIDDEGDENARIINALYEGIRDNLLESHPWNFATKRSAKLVADAQAPEFKYAYKYPIPADCLRILDIDPSTAKAVVEGDYILSDSPNIQIRYIEHITDETKFPPRFKFIYELKLAADICFAITHSDSLTKTRYALFNEQFASAKAVEGQEGDIEVIDNPPSWIQERY